MKNPLKEVSIGLPTDRRSFLKKGVVARKTNFRENTGRRLASLRIEGGRRINWRPPNPTPILSTPPQS